MSREGNASLKRWGAWLLWGCSIIVFVGGGCSPSGNGDVRPEGRGEAPPKPKRPSVSDEELFGEMPDDLRAYLFRESGEEERSAVKTNHVVNWLNENAVGKRLSLKTTISYAGLVPVSKNKYELQLAFGTASVEINPRTKIRVTVLHVGTNVGPRGGPVLVDPIKGNLFIWHLSEEQAKKVEDDERYQAVFKSQRLTSGLLSKIPEKEPVIVEGNIKSFN